MVLRLCCPVVVTVTRKGNIRIYIYICVYIDVMCHDIPIIAPEAPESSQAAPHLSRSRSPKLKAGSAVISEGLSELLVRVNDVLLGFLRD